MTITLVDLHSPQDVHLGPLLVIAPAITASFAGPWLAAAIGVLAVAAQFVIAVFHGGLATTNHIAQLIALTMLSSLIVFYCLVRARSGRELEHVRTVSDTVQKALLQPLAHRIGPLRVACLYLAADDGALIGGDLYAVARSSNSTRLIIGDVRGKGLAAIEDAARLIGAFREIAHQASTLPALAAALDKSMSRYLADLTEADDRAAEHFVTALLLEIPDKAPTALIVDCGHPPPLLLSQGRVTIAQSHQAPPLGIRGMAAAEHTAASLPFEAGDILLLYTDGVTEARNHNGVFYPLAARTAQWVRDDPDMLLHHLRRDLLAFAGGRLGDDAAVIAIQRVRTLHTPGPTVPRSFT